MRERWKERKKKVRKRLRSRRKKKQTAVGLAVVGREQKCRGSVKEDWSGNQRRERSRERKGASIAFEDKTAAEGILGSIYRGFDERFPCFRSFKVIFNVGWALLSSWLPLASSITTAKATAAATKLFEKKNETIFGKQRKNFPPPLYKGSVWL
ncbi:unnamed protein product [Enterobius vermicularis]|uniref:Uncharacterized protein n=1 Tax=Enterobius vermicularis TaxID=51028 RepID=A0A0N4VF50_ENTVE|nr:unnamed protein product [Enterobius vermicularis]